MSRLRACVLLLGLMGGVACAAARPPAPPPPGPPFLLAGEARVGRVEVEAAPGLGREARARLEAGTGDVLRQSVLDWLDQRGRWDPSGALAVQVQVGTLRLRSRLRALLPGSWGRPDVLAARVRVSRQGELLKSFGVEATSRLGGRAWWDPAERLRRLARILGQRVVEGL